MTFQTRRLSEEKPLPRSRGPGLVALTMRGCKGLLGWYRSWRERNKEAKSSAMHVRILKKIALILLSILLGAVLIAGTVQALISLQILTPSRILNAAGTELAADNNGHTNFLLLGSGDKSHDGVDLTDTIMIASLDPKNTKSAVLLSLPRDLYAFRTAKMGKGRINALYRDYKGYLRYKGKTAEEASREALQELGKELGTQLGVQIHYVVKVDFIAFTKAVDALGGIDIDVPYDIIDPEYPGPNYTYQTFEIHAGPQHIDGETALKYARSRHTTSDFDRSGRQQQILKSIAEKARQEGLLRNPGKLLELFKILTENVETTMSFREILGAAAMAEKIDRQNMLSMHLNNNVGYGAVMPSPGGFLYNPPRDQFAGASVLLPVTDGGPLGSWRQLRAFTALLFKNRSILLASPQIAILNAGAKSGLARTLGFELTRFGFPVSSIENLSENPSDETTKRPTSVVVYRSDADRALAEFLASLLQMKSVQNDPEHPEFPPEKLAQLSIVLGKDYAFNPLEHLVPSDPEPMPEDGSGSSSLPPQE